LKEIAVSGVADKYEVTMIKVELCTSYACSSPTTVASGSQAVNIASLSAGAEAGAFGSTAGLPIGTTFTHIRVTLNRAFTIEGEVNVYGNKWCSTDSADVGSATALHVGTLDTDGIATDGTDQTLYLADADDYAADETISISYGSPTYAVSMSVGSPSASEVQVIYKLGSFYTVGIVAPKIKVTFDVSTALGAGIADTNKCYMWPEEPVVSISLIE
jgi:hypothetical protein